MHLKIFVSVAKIQQDGKLYTWYYKYFIAKSKKKIKLYNISCAKKYNNYVLQRYLGSWKYLLKKKKIIFYLHFQGIIAR